MRDPNAQIQKKQTLPILQENPLPTIARHIQSASMDSPSQPPNIASRSQSKPQGLTTTDILYLQRTVGNDRVQQILARSPNSHDRARMQVGTVEKLQPKPLALQPTRVQAMHQAQPAKMIPPSGGSDVIQRRLLGTYDAVKEIGQKQSGSLSSRKARWGRKSTWLKLMDRLHQYEMMEETVVHDIQRLGSWNQMVKKQLSKLSDELMSMANLTRSWLDSSKHQKKIDQGDQDALNRAVALRFLLPRIQKERQDIVTKGVMGMASGNLKTIQGGERAVGGALNSLDLVKGPYEDQNTVGFFQEEKRREDTSLAAEAGINQDDPNLGARAVASYAIDQLLDLNMIVQTEFSTNLRHDTKTDENGKVSNNLSSNPKMRMGVYMAAARGKMAGGDQGAITGMAVNAKSQHALGGDTANVRDPALQRAMIKLQMLDALLGQVDRHMGNYFIEKNDKGQIIGVQGIDNDLAFGATLEENGRPITDPSTKGQGLQKYRGLPPIIDKELGNKLLKLKESDIEKTLDSLLAPQDIEATKERLRRIQRELAKMKKDGLFISSRGWGKKTFKQLTTTGVENYYSEINLSVQEIQLRKVLKNAGYDTIVQSIVPNDSAAQDRLYGDLINKLTSAVDKGILTFPRAKAVAMALPARMQQSGEKNVNNILPDMIRAKSPAFLALGKAIKKNGFQGDVDTLAGLIFNNLQISRPFRNPLTLEQGIAVAGRIPQNVAPDKLVGVVNHHIADVYLSSIPEATAIETALAQAGYGQVMKAMNAPADRIMTATKGAIYNKVEQSGQPGAKLSIEQGVKVATLLPNRIQEQRATLYGEEDQGRPSMMTVVTQLAQEVLAE